MYHSSPSAKGLLRSFRLSDQTERLQTNTVTAEKVKVESREIIYGEIIHGCSQTSEQDEASFERRRCEPPGGSEGMPLQKILKTRGSEMLFKHFSWNFSSEKSILGQNQDEAVASSWLMLATAF